MIRNKLSQSEVDKLISVEKVFARPTVYGHGKNDVNFQSYVGGKRVWQYGLWTAMLKRCFCEKEKLRYPTYQDVTCCSEWLSFATFLEWCNKEVDYKGKPQGMALDKDLIIKGNKVYSPEFCSFVPRFVNTLLLDSGKARGKWPIGVTFHRKSAKFIAAIKNNRDSVHLGSFDTPEEAFVCYKAAKESRIKLVAMQYRHLLRPDVYSSLISWEIIDEIALTPDF